ncbi:hypothetical protein ANN_25257 [Periplaneta americana]|uniref:Mos1 transposase HTH domain-containing protein n=1 Tax=Periplaneta americana TaxID=6978 RepID=A0ABQ8S129_PERAM|nr:hypothetical protein ANN_25257 [Periplaneta americana]
MPRATFRKILRKRLHLCAYKLQILQAIKPEDKKTVYGDDAISDGMVRRWVRKFNEGRISVHDEQHTGRPSLINDDLVRAVDEKIHENRRFTISSLSLNFPQMLRSGSQAGEFYNEGIERLVPRLDKCLNNGGDYGEK